MSHNRAAILTRSHMRVCLVEVEELALEVESAQPVLSCTRCNWGPLSNRCCGPCTFYALDNRTTTVDNHWSSRICLDNIPLLMEVAVVVAVLMVMAVMAAMAVMVVHQSLSESCHCNCSLLNLFSNTSPAYDTSY